MSVENNAGNGEVGLTVDDVFQAYQNLREEMRGRDGLDFPGWQQFSKFHTTAIKELATWGSTKEEFLTRIEVLRRTPLTELSYGQLQALQTLYLETPPEKGLDPFSYELNQELLRRVRESNGSDFSE